MYHGSHTTCPDVNLAPNFTGIALILTSLSIRRTVTPVFGVALAEEGVVTWSQRLQVLLALTFTTKVSVSKALDYPALNNFRLFSSFLVYRFAKVAPHGAARDATGAPTERHASLRQGFRYR